MVPEKTTAGSTRAPRRPVGERITVRLSRQDVNNMDLLIALNKYSTRSDVIKRALQDLILRHAENIEEEQKRLEKLQKLGAFAERVAELTNTK